MSEQDMVDRLRSLGQGFLPGLVGIEITGWDPGRVVARLAVEERHRAPNGYLHAAAVIALADTACGYGSLTNLPEGGTGFTTIDLSANFLGTARVGEAIEARAEMVHGGRTTQLWDATVRNLTSGKVMALFRCTQLVIYPR